MGSCAEFKITEPGFYRTRDGEKVEVVGRIREDANFPWVVVRTGSTTAYFVSVSGEFCAGCIDDHRDIVARWGEPVEKFERVGLYRNNVGLYRNNAGGRLSSENVWLHADVVSQHGFAGYIYERGGHTAISSLPCGWPVWENAGTEAAYLVIAAEPSNDDDMPIFPVAWRRLKKEGVE